MSAKTAVASDRVETFGIRVNPVLKHFIDHEVLPGTGVSAGRFWSGLADLVEAFGGRNRELLQIRAHMQAAIDDWHRVRAHQPHDEVAYRSFLRELGYLVQDGPAFTIDPDRIDRELSSVAGPQLVVPVTNARYAINAVNARWGSLYDAVYGTDVLGTRPPRGPYDPARGSQVIAWGKRFLDDIFPLAHGSHGDVSEFRVRGGILDVSVRGEPPTSLLHAHQFVGHTGSPDAPTSILLRNHGLHVELAIDRTHTVGRVDPAGVSDILLEAAVSVILDFEDSVAAVDAEDKVLAYRNWLGLMRGDLNAEVHKEENTFRRTLASDREYTAPDGSRGQLTGRALMLVRNVGLQMYTDAVLDRGGAPVPEGLLDALVTVACALQDLRGAAKGRNSKVGSVYVVKPKLHGPDEVAFVDQVFLRVEAVLGLEPNTVKLGVMDEERRTSANLKECIRAARHRLAFINTGFLDRTGDEIHTSMEAGAMVRKSEMTNQPWLRAYETRNVEVGLACGLRGRAQIGKGMWASPDQMRAMLEAKIAHPQAGANCAWVPSPTAATLHATHYHRIDVAARQSELDGRCPAPVDELLTIPLLNSSQLDERQRMDELENNAQGILGYVVRWVDHGIGCSKVPDIHGVDLMEDRATCRISSQHMANWLRHGITNRGEVIDVLERMAVIVDEQNEHDPAYLPMAPDFDGAAFQAAVSLVLDGARQPCGYTEAVLHAARAVRKATMTGGPR